MKKKILIITLFVFGLSFAQINPERKGKLFFNAGIEYRITPLPNDSAELSSVAIRTNSDKQNLGTSFYYGFKYFVFNKFSVGFSHSFRYAYFLSPNNEDIPGDYGIKKTKYALLMGYHFYLDYYLTFLKKSEIFIRVGISLLNRNSEFWEKEAVYDQNNELIGHWLTEQTYAFQPRNIAMGFKKNRMEYIIGIYTTKVNPYFVDTTTFAIPYINLNYTIGKL